jgi:predicted methyltransferase
MTLDYKLTETYENYLEAIYNMRDEGQKIINARLADRLGVKPPTVSQTLQRMSRDGLVRIDGEIALTKHGAEVAELRFAGTASSSASCRTFWASSGRWRTVKPSACSTPSRR